MANPHLVARLAALQTLATIPREELEWLAARGSLEAHPAGTVIAPKGEVTGMLPYSRMTGPPGDNYLEEAGELLAIDERHFPEMDQLVPDLHGLHRAPHARPCSGLQRERPPRRKDDLARKARRRTGPRAQ